MEVAVNTVNERNNQDLTAIDQQQIVPGLPTILRMMAMSLSLDTLGLKDLVVYFCARAKVALTTPP